MTFFLDLWHDLREKRLWPVAVGLLAAALAIPVLLLKPADNPTPAAPIVANSGKAETLPAVSVDASPVHGSKLETFSTRNPFKPLSDLKKEQEAADGSTGGGGGSAGGDAVAGDSSIDGGGGSSSTLPSGDSTGGGSSNPSGTPASGEQPREWFTFTVDVKFGEPTKQKTVKGVETLAGLPDANNPSVMFMGVTDRKTAVFLVMDESLVADGEGTCGGEACRTVELALDGDKDEESFTSTDGTTQYDLKLLDIDVVKTNDPSADTGSDKQAADPKAAGKEIATSAVAAASEPTFAPLAGTSDPDFGDE